MHPGRRGHEGVPVGQAQQRVEATLQADGRPRAVGDRGAAHRAGAVPRGDDDRVAQRQQGAEEALVQQGGHLAAARRVHEIGAADVAGEERVAGEDDPRRPVGLTQQVAQAAGRVTRRRQRLEREAAEGPRLPGPRRRAVPVRQLRVGVPDRGAGALGELDRADHVVLVAVRLDDVGDAAAGGGRPLDVDLGVATRVDDDRGAPVADDVGDVGDARRLDALEQHRAAPFGRLRYLLVASVAGADPTLNRCAAAGRRPATPGGYGAGAVSAIVRRAGARARAKAASQEGRAVGTR